MLMPRRIRHHKVQRGRMTGIAKGGTRVTYGDFGIQALEPGWITNRQIEAARIAMTRHIKRGGKVWINIFPDKPVTQKPAETRMGSGKGNPEHWVAVVKPGRVMFELSGVAEPIAREFVDTLRGCPGVVYVDPVGSLRAGLDLEMPFRQQRVVALPRAWVAGTLPAEIVAVAATRLIAATIPPGR